MAWKTLNQLHELLKKVDLLNNWICEKNEKFIHQCLEVEKSWSGSYAGWHGMMYFKDFKKPELRQRFSPEWGWINGLPSGWVEMEDNDIKKEIESKTNLSAEILETEGKILKNEAEKIQHEIKIELSCFDLTKLPEEQSLLNKLSMLKFGKTRQEFIADHLPASIQSRDSEALSQGICIPPHISYLAIWLSNISISESIKEFILLTDQLFRQIKIKQKGNFWNYINPFWLLWMGIFYIWKIIKLGQKHKLLSVLIFILTLLAIDYSLAWRNLIFIWVWCSSFFS